MSAVSTALHAGARHPALPFVLPFAVTMALLAGQSALTALAPLDARLLYPLRTAAVAVVLAWVLARAWRGARPLPGLGMWAAAGVVGGAVFAAWVGLDVPWARLGAGGAYDPYGGLSASLGEALVMARLAGAVLVVPLAEELFFRGYLMRVLVRNDFRAVAPGAVPWGVVAMQAGVFALAHEEVLAGFVAGFAYGALYRATGRLAPVVAAHALTNALLGAWVLHFDAWHLW